MTKNMPLDSAVGRTKLYQREPLIAETCPEEWRNTEQYRARLETLDPPKRVVPALSAIINEHREGGWVGTIGIAAHNANAEKAFDNLLSDGMTPGNAIIVKLVTSQSSEQPDKTIRSWPSIITSVNTTPLGTSRSDQDTLCTLTACDPVSYLREKSIWNAFEGKSLSETLGGALASAWGTSGIPARSPVMPGMPVVKITEQLREEIGTIPYVIATGETLGEWLDQICARLGVSIQIQGNEEGELIINLRDDDSSKDRLKNEIHMTVDPRMSPSETNLRIDELVINPTYPLRGGILDNPAIGGARRFGPSGGIESMIVAAQTELGEAENRGGFRHASVNLSKVRIRMSSCQPRITPNRIVQLEKTETENPTNETQNETEPFDTLFGSKEWQIADACHLYTHAQYWNCADLEKAGSQWKAEIPEANGLKIVSGTVDDGQSEIGESVERDRLGRIPIRFPFVVGETDEGQTSSNEETGWPASVHLSPIEPIAGNTHGFVPAHRQGDYCRIAVINPLYAEILGFGYRDDRFLKAKVRDATMGIIMRQNKDEWRGMLFQPKEEMDDDMNESKTKNDG